MRRLLCNLLVCWFGLFVLESYGQKQERSVDSTVKQPLNVILLIGDGMGLSQVSAGYYFNDEPSSFSRFKYIGLINTSSSKEKITDSAAGATAFACGRRSYNGSIGMDEDTVPMKNIVSILAEEGKAIGVVATSSITHATPACFYAHVASRSQHEDIALDLVDSDINFFAGGGIRFFARRTDGLNLLDSLTAKGFTMDTTGVNGASEHDFNNRYGYLLADDGMKPLNEERGNFLYNATFAAINHLGHEKEGFFLMVESSQIDWGGHVNDADYLISEQIEFDKLIGEVLDFAEKDGNTLVIVTADHETGGFTLTNHADSTGHMDYNTIKPSFASHNHSASLIPVFAFGPGQKLFSGIYQNSEIFHKILAACSGAW